MAVKFYMSVAAGSSRAHFGPAPLTDIDHPILGPQYLMERTFKTRCHHGLTAVIVIHAME